MARTPPPLSSHRRSWVHRLGAVLVSGARTGGARLLSATPRLERPVVAAALCLVAALVLRAGLLVLGVGAATSLLVVVAGLAAAVLVARRLPAALDGAASRQRWRALLFGLLAVLAVVQTARLGSFMAAPPDRARAILLCHDWQHSCVSAYVEAGRLDRRGAPNVYDVEQYKFRRIDGVQLDAFLYPPPFLLLPRLGLVLTDHFFTLRAAWFILEAGLVALALLLLARWIGGRAGLVVGLCALPVWVATPTLQTLQYGNFHLAAIALSVLAMIAFARRRHAIGGLLLACAVVGKVFPGVLVLWLLVQRRFAAVAWTLGAVVALGLLSLLVSGPAPFVAFFKYMVPQLLTGDAFFFLDLPGVANISHSVSGIALKLKLFGVPTSPAWVAGISWTYSALLVALVIRFARRPGGRLRDAQVWVALLHLGALRSTFIPQEYALTTPLWLLALLAPEAGARRRRWLALGALFVVCGTIVPVHLDQRPLPPWVVVGAVGVGQILGLGLALWTLLRAPPRTDAAVPRPPNGASDPPPGPLDGDGTPAAGAAAGARRRRRRHRRSRR